MTAVAGQPGNLMASDTVCSPIALRLDLRRGIPLPAKAGAPLTRAQVGADLLRAQQHPSWNAWRIGIPAAIN